MTKRRSRAHGAVLVAARKHGTNSVEADRARADLYTVCIEEYVAKTVRKIPELSAEQRQRIIAALDQ